MKHIGETHSLHSNIRFKSTAPNNDSWAGQFRPLELQQKWSEQDGEISDHF